MHTHKTLVLISTHNMNKDETLKLSAAAGVDTPLLSSFPRSVSEVLVLCVRRRGCV